MAFSRDLDEARCVRHTVLVALSRVRLAGHATAYPRAGVLGVLIVREEGFVDRVSARRIPTLGQIFLNRGGFYDSFQTPDSPTEVEVVSGSCMALRASMLEEIGLLDEATFLYWEEFILAEKVRRSSYKTILFPDVRVVHKGGRAVKALGTAAARAFMDSMDHYLKTYRGVGYVRRRLVGLGPAASFLPGTLRTMLGLRAKTT